MLSESISTRIRASGEGEQSAQTANSAHRSELRQTNETTQGCAFSYALFLMTIFTVYCRFRIKSGTQ